MRNCTPCTRIRHVRRCRDGGVCPNTRISETPSNTSELDQGEDDVPELVPDDRGMEDGCIRRTNGFPERPTGRCVVGVGVGVVGEAHPPGVEGDLLSLELRDPDLRGERQARSRST